MGAYPIEFARKLLHVCKLLAKAMTKNGREATDSETPMARTPDARSALYYVNYLHPISRSLAGFANCATATQTMNNTCATKMVLLRCVRSARFGRTEYLQTGDSRRSLLVHWRNAGYPLNLHTARDPPAHQSLARYSENFAQMPAFEYLVESQLCVW